MKPVIHAVLLFLILIANKENCKSGRLNKHSVYSFEHVMHCRN